MLANGCGRCKRVAVRGDAAGKKLARLGFEPRQREPKSLVLPLHHRAGRFFYRISRSGRHEREKIGAIDVTVAEAL
jgi:hypothetical protein